MALSHESLHKYFEDNFALMYYHKASISDIENMLPWERYVYLGMLERKVEEELEEMQQWNKN